MRFARADDSSAVIVSEALRKRCHALSACSRTRRISASSSRCVCPNSSSLLRTAASTRPPDPQRHRRPDADRQVGRRLEERIRVARVGRSAGQVERRQDLERHRVLAPGRRVHPGPPHQHRGVHIDGAVLHLDLARRHGRELVRVGRALGELGAGRQAVLPEAPGPHPAHGSAGPPGGLPVAPQPGRRRSGSRRRPRSVPASP